MIADVVPTRRPPRRETRRPQGVTPPFVPGGTTWRVVKRRGGEEESIPSCWMGETREEVSET